MRSTTTLRNDVARASRAKGRWLAYTRAAESKMGINAQAPSWVEMGATASRLYLLVTFRAGRWPANLSATPGLAGRRLGKRFVDCLRGRCRHVFARGAEGRLR
jgi:hypothetical protein